MKLNIKYQERKNDNDCWNVALSLFTGKSYETIRKHFKAFISNDGKVYNSVVKGYCNDNYCIINVDLPLDKALSVYNNTNGIIFLMKSEDGDHALFIKDNTLYDDIDERGLYLYIESFNVTNVILPYEDLE